MLSWLLRLLIVGLLLAAAARLAARYLNREEDYDDFDDLDAGLEFTETPVEIDVSADTTGDSPGVVEGDVEPAPVASAMPTKPLGVPDLDSEAIHARATEQQAAESSTGQSTSTSGESDGEGENHSLIEITGIGPTYAARLQEAGISSIEELAKANPDSLVEQIEVIGGRTTVENWISQAQNLTQGGGQNGRSGE